MVSPKTVIFTEGSAPRRRLKRQLDCEMKGEAVLVAEMASKTPGHLGGLCCGCWAACTRAVRQYRSLKGKVNPVDHVSSRWFGKDG